MTGVLRRSVPTTWRPDSSPVGCGSALLGPQLPDAWCPSSSLAVAGTILDVRSDVGIRLQSGKVFRQHLICVTIRAHALEVGDGFKDFPLVSRQTCEQLVLLRLARPGSWHGVPCLTLWLGIPYLDINYGALAVRRGQCDYGVGGAKTRDGP